MNKRLRNIFDQYSQQENHLTNSLLLVLDRNKNLLRSILKKFDIDIGGKKNINLLSQVAPRTIEERSSIPDGFIYTDDYDFCIGIETKIESNALRKGQIRGHLKQLSQYDKSYLLVLTPDKDEPSIITTLKKDHKNLKFISWITLLELMAKIGHDKGKNEIGKFVYDEFMSNVERHYHMTPFTGFNFREGYDRDLAVHYVKKTSEIITPEMRKLFPLCKNKRPRIGGAIPWESWYSTEQVQNCVHPTLGVRPEKIGCQITLANGCKREWKNLDSIMNDSKRQNVLEKILRSIYEKAPKGSETTIYTKQRHFLHRTKAVDDAIIEINIAGLLGIGKSKENKIWWNTLKEIARTKTKYNYELGIRYDLNYDMVPVLKNPKAIDVIVKCFKNLKPVYKMLTS